jgi:AraC-like DNA-binding protein
MTSTILQQAYWELFEEKKSEGKNHAARTDEFDTTWAYPSQLGQGYWREIQLRDGLELTIANYQLHEDLTLILSDCEHPIECDFNIASGSGQSSSDRWEASLCGSGLAPAERYCSPGQQRLFQVNVHMEPDQFRSSVGNSAGEIPESLHHLLRSPDQKYYVRTGLATSKMYVILQQILQCPYNSTMKRMYLESKVLELLVLLVEQDIESRTERNILYVLKPDDIDRIHLAKKVLLERIVNPPSLPQLARLSGLNECTLKRGFRQVFSTTVFGYLHHYRLEQARQLLETGDMNITEITHAVGFADRSYFAAAFRKKFGVNPSHYAKSLPSRQSLRCHNNSC